MGREDPSLNKPRDKLLELLGISLQAVRPGKAVKKVLAAVSDERVSIIAIGKGAPGMMRAAVEFLGERAADGLVITSAEYFDKVPVGVTVAIGSHPVPDQKSLDSGQALIEFIDRQPDEMPLLFLISGGTSAAVEMLASGLSPADLEKANQWLLASGKPIEEINLVRKGMSRIKGGGLLSFTGNRPVTGFFISDVIGDDPADIGSGLLSVDQALEEKLWQLDLPRWLSNFMKAGSKGPQAIVPDSSVNLSVILSNSTALRAAQAKASENESNVVLHEQPLRGEAETVGREISSFLIAAEPGVYLWGGETTVTLPDHPGRGGRSQQFALAAAIEISGREDIWILSAGTDGIDGNSPDAGALVDGGTLRRGELAGLDAHDSLRRADAGSFLDESGDLIHTGPTGTNVMDIVIALKR